MSQFDAAPREPVLFVVTGPSGAGKKAVMDRVRAQDPQLGYSVSATTRAPRPGEENRREYYFMTSTEFRAAVDADRFIEYADVHGDLYGTLESEVEKLRATDKDVVLELDVQGAAAVRAKYPDAVLIFIVPPRFEVLRERLVSRGSEDHASVERRLDTARAELRQIDKFDYVVVNDRLEDAVADVRAIIRAERCRAHRQNLNTCKGDTTA